MSQNSNFRRRGNFKSSSYGGNRNNRGRANKGRQPKKDYIHPSKFVQAAKPVANEVYESKHLFDDFDIAPLLKQNLVDMGYTMPSPIQDQTIPLSLEGRDIVGIANTGTGKTAAFAVPVLNQLINNPSSKAVIVAPTRELAMQIEEQFRAIGKGSGLNGAVLIGGMPMRPQLNDLQYNPQIIIGTPGRIKDHLERRSLDISDCNMIVLDEVDRMLDMGFVNDMRTIISQTSDDRQSLYFSATLDERVKSLISTFSHDPVHVSVKSTETSANVNQDIVPYRGAEKVDRLHDILIVEQDAKVIIFDDTHRSVERLSKELVARGFVADAIHGGKNQSQRKRVLDKFKSNKIKILVATDVASRGLDVSDITHVINYSTPQTYDDYVHRIGRTGRAGKAGKALTFIEA